MNDVPAFRPKIKRGKALLTNGTLKSKMLAAGVTAALAFAALTAVNIYSVNKGISALSSVYEGQVEPAAALQEMAKDLLEVRFRMAGVLLDQMPGVGSSNQLKDAVANLPKQWTVFKDKTAGAPVSQAIKDLSTQIEKNLPLFLKFADKLTDAYSSSDKDKKALASLLEDDWPVIQGGLVKPLQRLIPEQDNAVKDTYEASRRSGKKLISLGLTMSVSAMFIAGVFGYLISAAILNPMKRMVAVMQQIADNNLTVADLEITSKDEIGQAGLALNTVKNNLRRMIATIAHNAGQLAQASKELLATSQQIASNSEETATQAQAVSVAGEEVASSVRVVVAGSEQMLVSIREIATSSNQAAQVANNAVDVAQSTNQTIGKLGESSMEVAKVIKTITSIAHQTNLLALNASIEAARAGAAGAGFAVVANEVKELAKETATATEDISREIETIQHDAAGSVRAIGEVRSIINRISDISNEIAVAVEKQTATTTEIGHNLGEAAKVTTEIAHSISNVAEAAKHTTAGANDTQNAARLLTQMALELQSLMAKFRVDDSRSTPSVGLPS